MPDLTSITTISTIYSADIRTNELKASAYAGNPATRNDDIFQEKLEQLRASIGALQQYSMLIIDANNPLDARTQAGVRGFMLSVHLLEIFGPNDNDTIKKILREVPVQEHLNIGYAEMGLYRNTGYFHLFVIAIASLWLALKSYFVLEQNEPPVKIGEASHGFFGLTTRQRKVVAIDNAFHELLEQEGIRVNP